MSQNWKIEVVKYTGVDSLRMANSFTTNKESVMPLRRAYALGHTPIRTQRFYIKMYGIPLFCASQLVRSTQGVQWYMLSKRTDRGGEDFTEVCHRISKRIGNVSGDNFFMQLRDIQEEIDSLCLRFDRHAPTNLMADCNAEFIMNMSMKRLCAKASAETHQIWGQVISEIAKIDPDLALFCVKPCIHHGFCREHKGCGFDKTELFKKMRENYILNFVQ